METNANNADINQTDNSELENVVHLPSTPPPEAAPPKRPRGRPRKTWTLVPPAVSTRPESLPIENLWTSGENVDTISQSNFQTVYESLTQQQRQFQYLCDTLYATIQQMVGTSCTVEPGLFSTFENYQQRLRQINNDLSELGKTRLDEIKILQALKEQSANKVTAIHFTMSPPPEPVETPYQEADYRLKERDIEFSESATPESNAA